MSTARRRTAKKSVACLSILVGILLPRSCGAFVLSPTGAGARGVPANTATGHGSAFGEVGLGLTMAADGAGLPGQALPATGSSFVPEEITLDKEEEDTRRAAMSSALAEMGEHEGGGGAGGEGNGGGALRKGWRKGRGAVARIWKGGDSPSSAAEGVQVGAGSYSREYDREVLGGVVQQKLLQRTWLGKNTGIPLFPPPPTPSLFLLAFFCLVSPLASLPLHAIRMPVSSSPPCCFARAADICPS